MKRIYSVLVENRSGVLCKVAGLFWRRCFNIDSLAVGETEDKNVSNMVIVSSGDRRTLEQIEKQLNKKLDVIKVKTFDETESINRELMLVKVRYNRTNRKDIMENCEIMDAKIVDMRSFWTLCALSASLRSRGPAPWPSSNVPNRADKGADPAKSVSLRAFLGLT